VERELARILEEPALAEQVLEPEELASAPKQRTGRE